MSPLWPTAYSYTYKYPHMSSQMLCEGTNTPSPADVNLRTDISTSFHHAVIRTHSNPSSTRKTYLLQCPDYSWIDEGEFRMGDQRDDWLWPPRLIASHPSLDFFWGEHFKGPKHSDSSGVHLVLHSPIVP